jgi:hypothetical protein
MFENAISRRCQQIAIAEHPYEPSDPQDAGGWAQALPDREMTRVYRRRKWAACRDYVRFATALEPARYYEKEVPSCEP